MFIAKGLSNGGKHFAFVRFAKSNIPGWKTMYGLHLGNWGCLQLLVDYKESIYSKVIKDGGMTTGGATRIQSKANSKPFGDVVSGGTKLNTKAVKNH